MSITLEEALASLRVIELPMRTKFRNLEVRQTALIKGEIGWAEFAPFVEYSDQESLPWLNSAIEAASSPLSQGLHHFIPVNATIPASNDEAEIAEIISWYPGVETVKIKVGGKIEEDLLRISRVRKYLPGAKLRVDVNGSWSVDEALFNINSIYNQIDGETLEYIEQPVASLSQLRELKERLKIDVKIAGDEILRKAPDPFDINLEGAIDILMLKVSPLGGVERSLKLAAHHRLPIVVSSALESAVGISRGLQLASKLPKLEYAAGLATGALFKEDICDIPIENGAIRLASYPIDLARVEKYEIKGESLGWWRNRITNVWKLRSRDE